MKIRRPLLAAAALALASSCTWEVDQGGAMGAGFDEPSNDEEAVHAKCGVGPTVLGIDVSSWQGNINWGSVASSGVKFAIIRVSDGTGYHDPKFAANWSGAKAHGVIRGAYQFFRSNEDPIAQANLLLSTMGTLQPGDLPPMIDVETTDGVSSATRRARIKQWLDRVEQATGMVPMIYTGGYFWDDNVGADFSRYPLVHAGYTGGSCPSTVSSHWSTWTMWQFTSSGHVSGISGNVDEDRFNGNLDALKKLGKGGGGGGSNGGSTARPAQHWFVGDFDGDHAKDLGKVWNANGKIDADIHISDGTSFAMHRFATDQGSYYDTMHWVVGDFTGDGRDDLLDWWPADGKLNVDVHGSNGGKFTNQRFATGQGSVSSGMKWKTGDFNGDGKKDLMKLWSDGGSMTADVHLSNGSSFTMHRFATKQGGIWDGMKWFVGDFNGDGKSDLMKLWNDGGKMSADVHTSNGSSFAMHRFATKQGGYTDGEKWFVGDFNGDGKDDLMKLWDDGGSMSADVHISNGSSFTMQRFATKQGGIWAGMKWFVGDFDGDGKDDVMKLWNDGGSMSADVHLSSGSSFAMHRFATKQGGFWADQVWRVADFDGDGRSDLAKDWDDGGKMTVDVHLSTGSAFQMHRFATKQGGIW